MNAWRVNPVVEALHAWRGVPCPVAVTMGAALGALTRVEPPRERMQGWGLRPSASSSGEHRQQGSIPNARNPQARRAPVEDW